MRAAKSILAAVAALALTACVPQPLINVKGFEAPKKVVLLDIPKMHNAAVVGVIVPHAPGFPWFHFSEKADYYFLGFGEGPKLPDHAAAIGEQTSQQILNRPQPVPMGQVVGGALAGAVVGALIQSSAAETFKRSQAFQEEISKRLANHDLGADFMSALQRALEARGVAATLSDARKGAAPRMVWPAVDAEGNKFPTLPADAFPAQDADLLVQVSPLAFYNAPGPLNSYTRRVSVGVVLYDARTKKFLGRQTVWFDPPASRTEHARFEYSRYDSLVEDLPAAAPALRDALLSLVPRVADLIKARP